MTTKKSISQQNENDKNAVLNEPLALGSNESGNYVAVFACRWFSVLFDIVFTLLANGWCAGFAVL